MRRSAVVSGQDLGRGDGDLYLADDGYDRTFVGEPSTAQVADALISLNGADRNDLYLRSGFGQWMGFGGGPDHVIVTYSDAEEGPRYQAVATESRDPDEHVIMIVGGQEVQVSSRFIIDLEDVVLAALTFAETDRRPESLAWEPC